MTIEDFQSLYLRSILPLFVIANYEGCIFYYVLWRPKYQSPGTRKEHCLRRTLAALVVNESKLPLTRLHKLSSRSLFTSCLLGQHSSVERALSLKPIVCFSGAMELLQLSTRCVYNSQSNSLCLRRTLAALVVNVSKLPLTRLHKLSHLIRKTYELSLCSLTVPDEF